MFNLRALFRPLPPAPSPKGKGEPELREALQGRSLLQKRLYCRYTPFPLGEGAGGRGLLLVLALLLTSAPVRASQGTFTDAAGAKHSWRINRSHTLFWDNAPYLPVGGVFQAKSWAAAATEADFQSDVAALTVLKERGVNDLYVQPAREGLTRIKPAAIQRLLDHLDANGFTYGISLNDGPRAPLIGHIVRPGAYRKAGVTGGIVRIPVGGSGTLLSALYFAVNPTGGEVVTSGDATLVTEGARVVVPQAASGTAVFLVPEKVYEPRDGMGLPNLWDGFDSYRDAVLVLFSQIKLGKGFRFFVDPLPPELGLREEGERFIPSGDGFRTEWATWLSGKYDHLEKLYSAWGLERDLNVISDAATLIPLWSGGKGIQVFYDRKNGRRIQGDATRSRFWNDLDDFKAESVRRYMNTLADVLKREVADVPVVYRSSGHSRLFAGLPAKSGFDGIGIEAYARGRDLITQSAGYIYAQAHEAPKAMWLPVTGTQDVRQDNKSAPGYPARDTLFSDLDQLREIGAKGFFVNGLRIADPGRKNFNLLDAPDQLTWLRDYKAMISALSGLPEYQPKVVFYPRSLPVASLKPLVNGGWWLPTDLPATSYDFGPVGRAYGLATEQGTVYYLWNPHTTRKIRLRLPPLAKDAPPVLSSDPTASAKKGVLTVTIGPEPISIRNLPYLPAPMETFEELTKEAETLVMVARRHKDPRNTLYRERLDGLRIRYKQDNPLPTILNLQELLTDLRQFARPYEWVEAETGSHTFDENTHRAGASGGQVLIVGDRGSEAPPATATFRVDIEDAGLYHLWVAATPAAPLAFRVDGEPIATRATSSAQGASYADGLVWTYYASITLSPGGHLLEMRTEGSATVDTLLLTRSDFVPDGPNPPPIQIMEPAPPPTAGPNRE